MQLETPAGVSMPSARVLGLCNASFRAADMAGGIDWVLVTIEDARRSAGACSEGQDEHDHTIYLGHCSTRNADQLGLAVAADCTDRGALQSRGRAVRHTHKLRVSSRGTIECVV